MYNLSRLLRRFHDGLLSLFDVKVVQEKDGAGDDKDGGQRQSVNHGLVGVIELLKFFRGVHSNGIEAVSELSLSSLVAIKEEVETGFSFQIFIFWRMKVTMTNKS